MAGNGWKKVNKKDDKGNKGKDKVVAEKRNPSKSKRRISAEYVRPRTGGVVIRDTPSYMRTDNESLNNWMANVPTPEHDPNFVLSPESENQRLRQYILSQGLRPEEIIQGSLSAARPTSHQPQNQSATDLHADVDSDDGLDESNVPNSIPNFSCHNAAPSSTTPSAENIVPRRTYIRGGSSTGVNNLSEDTPMNNMPSVEPSADSTQDERIEIRPVGRSSFTPFKVVERIAPDCISIDFKPGWCRISDVDNETVERWFNRFKRIAKWDPKFSCEVKRNFKIKCGDLIRSSKNSYLRGRSKKGAVFATPEVLAKWREDAETNPKFKKLSEQNKQNCKGEKSQRGHTKHRLGPKPPHVHVEQMTKETGNMPSPLEFYNHMYRRPDGTFLDPEGDRITRDYDALRTALVAAGSASEPIPHSRDVELMADVVGLSQRTRLPRCLGDAATLVEGSRFHVGSSQSSAHSHAPSSQPVTEDLERRMTEMVTNLTQSIKEELKNSIADEVISRLDILLRGRAKDTSDVPTRGDDHEGDSDSASDADLAG